MEDVAYETILLGQWYNVRTNDPTSPGCYIM